MASPRYLLKKTFAVEFQKSNLLFRIGRVVQLARTSDLHSEGHRFKSCPAYQNHKTTESSSKNSRLKTQSHRKHFKNSRFSNIDKEF